MYNTIDDAKLAEQHHIFLHKSLKEGYNSTLGGDGTVGYKHTDVAKRTLSEKKKGKSLGPFTEEHKRHLSENKKRYWRTHKSSIGERVQKTWKLVDINGNITIIDNLRRYMSENSLVSSGIYNLRKGKVKRYKQFVSVEPV
jgi:hypothetical protein